MTDEDEPESPTEIAAFLADECREILESCFPGTSEDVASTFRIAFATGVSYVAIGKAQTVANLQDGIAVVLGGKVVH